MNTELKNKIVKYFETQPVLKAYVFGSFARNDEDETSDVDLIVEFDETQHIGLEYFQMIIDLEKLTNREVDLVSEGYLSKYIQPFVDKEKKLIYERKAR